MCVCIDFKQTGMMQGNLISNLFRETVSIINYEFFNAGPAHEDPVQDGVGTGKFWKCFSRVNSDKVPFDDQEGR